MSRTFGVGLLDVARSVRTVDVAGAAVAVPGVSARGIAILFNRFPIFRELFAGKTADFTPESLIELVPDAIAAIIAAGTGAPGDAEAEAVAAGLSATDQLNLLAAILDATMPGGFGPFVEKLTAAMAGLGVDAAPSAPDAPALPTNIPGMKLRRASKL